MEVQSLVIDSFAYRLWGPSDSRVSTKRGHLTGRLDECDKWPANDQPTSIEQSGATVSQVATGPTALVADKWLLNSLTCSHIRLYADSYFPFISCCTWDGDLVFFSPDPNRQLIRLCPPPASTEKKIFKLIPLTHLVECRC